MANPPLPDMIDVLDRTTGIDERPGLREFARLWLAWAPAARAEVATEARRLARPSLAPASWRALGRTGGTLVQAQLRAHARAHPAALVEVSEGAFAIEFELAQAGISPGQMCVLYDGDRVVGSGTIG